MTANPRPNVRPTIANWQQIGPHTRFFIDYSWWDRSGLSLQTYLQTQLGGQAPLPVETEEVDMIDPRTGEVRQVSGFEYALQHYFRQLPADFLHNASLVDAIFFVLLTNGNQPMSAAEIAAQLHRPAEIIYQTLGGSRIYQGIRPYREE